MAEASTPGALDGIRIIEIASGGAVAYAGLLFAQSGAEVIRIEPPGGDAIRRAGPFPGDQFGLDGGGLHRLLNGGKRSVALDITSEAGARFAGKLIASSQLVIGNWQTPAASALPLADAEAMAERFPRHDLRLGQPLRADRALRRSQGRQPDHRGRRRHVLRQRQAGPRADGLRR